MREAFLAVPRHSFIPDTARERGLRAAYTDEAVPTRTDAYGMALSSCSQPGIVAQMLELLDLHTGQRVLEIGAGTGYNAALLSVLAGGRGRVISVDIDRQTASQARRALSAVGARARVIAGDGREGWAPEAPYDRIIATASSDHVPRPWFDQLVEGGILVMPLRVTDALPFPQVVAALVKERDGFRSREVVPGGFMRLRDPGDDVSLPWPQISAVDESGGKRTSLAILSGSPLASLDSRARCRLLRRPSVSAAGGLAGC